MTTWVTRVPGMNKHIGAPGSQQLGPGKGSKPTEPQYTAISRLESFLHRISRLEAITINATVSPIHSP
jgi:hypothetical protein